MVVWVSSQLLSWTYRTELTHVMLLMPAVHAAKAADAARLAAVLAVLAPNSVPHAAPRALNGACNSHPVAAAAPAAAAGVQCGSGRGRRRWQRAPVGADAGCPAGPPGPASRATSGRGSGAPPGAARNTKAPLCCKPCLPSVRPRSHDPQILNPLPQLHSAVRPACVCVLFACRAASACWRSSEPSLIAGSLTLTQPAGTETQCSCCMGKSLHFIRWL